MRILRDLLLNPILSLSLAITLLGIGGAGLLMEREERQMTDLLARLRPAAEAGAGAAAYLEGRIAAQQPARRGGLVTWMREEYVSCEDTSCWTVAGSETPPLLVHGADGGAWTVGGSYGLASTADTVVEAAPGWTRGTVRSRGFVAGRPVVAVGRVTADGREMEADVLYAGTRAAVLAERRALESTGRWFVAMVVAGLGLLGVCAWQVRRFLREEANSRTRAELDAPTREARSPRRTRARRGA